MAYNGGGARCGFDGRYQIKGIGPNCLVGKFAPITYSDGFISLSDALREAVWGEILHVTLPHGAVRAVAVLSLDEVNRVRQSLPHQGLLVREAVVRPAHFERSIYFRPKKEFRELLADSTARSIDSLCNIVDYLPYASRPNLYQSCHSATNESRFRAGIVELSKRFAENLAYASAKHIFHGGLSASNLSIDGRWIDFGSITTLPVSGFFDDHFPSLLKAQHLPFFEHIDNVCFYAEKYIGSRDGFFLDSASIAKETYYKAYSEASIIFEVEEFGIPCRSLQSNPEVWLAIRHFHSSLEALKNDGILSLSSTEAVITNIANKILQVAACININETHTEKILINAPASTTKLINTIKPNYSILLDTICSTQQLDELNFAFGVLLNIFRHSRAYSYINEYSISENIKTIIAMGKPEARADYFYDYLNTLKLRVEAAMAVPIDLDFLCWKSSVATLHYNVRTSRFHETSLLDGHIITFKREDVTRSKSATAHEFIEFIGGNEMSFINEKIKSKI